MDETDRSVRYAIFQHLINTCRMPTLDDLAIQSSVPKSFVKKSLQRLEDLHHLRLYAPEVSSPTPIMMVHPFSHLPTPYRVSILDETGADSDSYFANCAWCAFGMAAMLAPGQVAVVIQVMSPTSGKQLSFKIVGIELVNVTCGGNTFSRDDCWTVFCVPLRHWWTDVHFACSCIQMCASKQEAERYHERHGFEKGEIMNLDTLWELSKAWYHDKAEYQYERKSSAEAKELLQKLGLVSNFWSVE